MHFLYLSFSLLIILAHAYQPHNLLGERSFPYQYSTAEIKALISSLDPISSTQKHLERILIPRVSDTANNVLVREYIINILQDGFNGRKGWHVEEDEFEGDTPFGKKKFVNIVATKDPRASRRLILAAHFDSKYFAPPNDQFVGAVDSAFPCAVLLDIAESLDGMLESRISQLEHDDLPVDEDEDLADTTLQLVFFDGEEAFVSWTDTDSIYGARHLAETWESTYVSYSSPSVVTSMSSRSSNSSSTANDDAMLGFIGPRRLMPPTSLSLLSTIEHLILLDLLGSKPPNEGRPMIKNYFKDTAWLYSALSSTEARIAALDAFVDPSIPESSDESAHMSKDSFVSYFHPLPAKASQMVNIGYMGDDHVPFLRRGVPVLHLIPEPFPRVWHTLADDATALDKASMRRWVVLMRIFVSEYLGLRPPLPTSREERSQDEVTREEDKATLGTREELGINADVIEFAACLNAAFATSVKV
ncbi:glutaminyl-peptide cyclotransferase-like protein [Lentinula aff. lateritia]|uniref:Glutaminyl-peptide cyclotransferase-like protein n=1 Tax=Lentinula aff. lateritia TaxID=2804960 RepID=A0ACC1UDB6_9AGAR|nr:glutaminyl-peptide cyclotransferase-like protein [Lentinula aff. lateritia]